MQLSIEATCSATHCLLLLATSGISTVTMNFDVGGVDHAQLGGSALGEALHNNRPEARLSPASEVTVDSLPTDEREIKSPPGATFFKDQ